MIKNVHKILNNSKYIILSIIFLTLPLTITPNEIKTDQEATISKPSTYRNIYSTIISSFSLIFISEFGDRTFFVIMIYSLTNEPLKTFLVATPTLLLLNLAAISFGSALPIFVYVRILQWIAFFVFLLLSAILLHDGIILDYHAMKKDFITTYRKYSKQENLDNRNDQEARNLRQGLLEGTNVNESDRSQSISLRNLNQEPPAFDTTWSFVTSLILSECGDKSQISGIFIGALHDFYSVLIGTSLAFIFTILISIGIGNYISPKISKKTIMIVTGCIYLLFSLSYLLQLIGYI